MGKYEVKFQEGLGLKLVRTSSWFELMKLRLTRRVVYCKVCVD